MTVSIMAVSPRVTEVFTIAKQFSPTERLVLAKFLLDSIMSDETQDEAD